MKNSVYALFLIGAIVIACNSGNFEDDQKGNTEPVDDQIVMQGKVLAQTSGAALMGKLSSEVASSGFAGAVSFCNTAASQIIDSLSIVYQADISRKTFKTRNPNNYPDSADAIVLKEYLSMAQNGKSPSIEVRQHSGGTTFYAPIYTQSFCLNCHGNPEENILPETLSVLDSLYPDDKARGYTAKQLRGMWCITFKAK